MTSRTISSTIPAAQQVGRAPMSHGRLWASRVLSGLPVLFFMLDGGMKLFKPAFVVEATVHLGYPASAIVGIGLTLIASTLLYAIPWTSALGAILLTGYLGGAVASNVRAETPAFNIVFPLVFGCFVWGGLWLRGGAVRHLIPFASEPMA